MRFLELKERVRQCIKYGDFTMSSGQKTKWMCDLLEARDLFPFFMKELGLTDPMGLFGVETGGYLLAREVNVTNINILVPHTSISLIRKTGEIYLGKTSRIYSDGKTMNSIHIVDDVVSTEKTFNMAKETITAHNIKGTARFYAVLDRRAKKDTTMKITSLFTPKDFDLKP